MFGFVGIDSIAGPTELVIFADSGAPIDWTVWISCLKLSMIPRRKVF